ncbi:MAG: hypothetical protein K2F65_07405, partial [Eubacterium sp.]|nr:hypothetical protein [Eubacterium sp.]
MKKVLKFLAYPLTAIFVTAVNAALFVLSTEFAVSFIQPVSLIFYIFLGGIVLSKIKDKTTKLGSVIFTALILLAAGIACAAIMSDGNDTAVWISIMAFPFSIPVASIFHEHYLDTIYLIAFVISTVLPVLVSYIVSKIFEMKKKPLKIVLIAVMAFICIGSAVQGALSIFSIAKDSIYENGVFYNAYYDINGNKYESNEEVPYYDKDGNVYY